MGLMVDYDPINRMGRVAGARTQNPPDIRSVAFLHQVGAVPQCPLIAKSGHSWSRLKIGLLAQFAEERPCLPQVGGINSFGEAIMDWRKQFAGAVTHTWPDLKRGGSDCVRRADRTRMATYAQHLAAG